MISHRGKWNRPHRQGGYALLMVMFIAALILAGAMVVNPNILTEGRREKEEEMIWRGKQYVRGIKLYHRKLGRFPTSIDDLTKPQTGSLRFMRQAYKDPMNKEDGSWRLIYVGPAGQLIGSLKPPQTISLQGGNGLQAGSLVPKIPTVDPLHPDVNPAESVAGAQPGTPAATATTPGVAPQNPSVPGEQLDASGNLAPNALADTPTIIGGNIIGVGSKIAAPSVIIYDKAKNYRLFEFIWDPSKDVVAVGQPGTQVGQPNAPGQNPAQGQNPFGIQPIQNPANPPAQNPNPGAPPQQP